MMCFGRIFNKDSVKKGFVSVLPHGNFILIAIFLRTVVPRLLLVSNMGDFLAVASEIGTPGKSNLVAALESLQSHDLLPKLGLYTLAFIVEKVMLISEVLPLQVCLKTIAPVLFGGLLPGALLSSTAETVGAAVNFFIGRAFFTQRVRALTFFWDTKPLGEAPWFGRLERAAEKDGFKLTFLLRLSHILPIPFDACWYILGALPVRPWEFVAAHWLGCLKTAFLDACLGMLLLTSAGLSVGGEETQHIIAAKSIAFAVVAFLLQSFATKLAKDILGLEDKAKDGVSLDATSKWQEAPPEVEYHGPPELAGRLGDALLCQWRGNGKRAGVTNGFHPYKALMEPLAASMMLELLPGDGAILDPFVGSGTIMIEVMLAGRAAIGTDVSPLAVGIARHHCWTPSPAALDELRAAVAAVVASMDGMDGLDWEHSRRLVAACKTPYSPEVVGALWFLLSVEEQNTWPSWRKPCTVAERYGRTGERYLGKLAALVAAVPAGTPAARIGVADARVCDQGAELVDGVLSSPPYPGVFNYLHEPGCTGGMAKHVLGGCDSRSGHTSPEEEHRQPNQEPELGSRRELESEPGSFAERWQADTEAWLRACAARLRPQGRIAIIIGDDAGINTLTSVRDAAAAVSATQDWDLRILASASSTDKLTRPWKKQRRRAYRIEHTILLEKTMSAGD